MSTSAISIEPLAVASDDLRWVERTRDAMTVDEKLAQLFVLSSNGDDAAEIDSLIANRPGGIHRFPSADLETVWFHARRILENCAVPPLMSGDIEGGTSSYGFATAIPNQLGIAACADLNLSAALAQVVALESRAMGFNWTLMPVVDLSRAFRSAVVGTRSFGADPEAVLMQASTYVRIMQHHGIAATAKHWPGEGIDDRDQHLVTTVNSQSMAEWRSTFGRIYRSLIDEGVMVVMAGHIAFPAFARSLDAKIGREAFRPASVSSLLNQRLLRDELGFRGAIVSDATVMAGLTSWSDRAEAVPAVIENGCDLFLFSRDPGGDLRLMREGLRHGALSETRLEQAVTTVLTLKAKLGLHRKSVDERLPPISQTRAMLRTPENLGAARQAAERSVTLVKDIDGLLPVIPDRYPRVVLLADDGWTFTSGVKPNGFEPVRAALAARGFAVREFDPEAFPTREDADLLLYVLGQESTPTIATPIIDWSTLHGGSRKAMARFNREVPTVIISFGHPYFLNDATNVSTYINAYSSIPEVQMAAMSALFGDAAFRGRSPVDPFCGREQLAY